MYAVIETGGKQYRVEYGKELHVELLDATPGSEVTFDRVLLVRTDDATQVGAPIVSGAKVTALVVGQERGVKTISFKYRPKARSRIMKGHRQELHLVRISEISFGGVSAKAAAEKIAGMSLPATMVAKEAVNRAFETTLAEGVRFERRTFHATFAFEDRSEGMSAFADKRKAAWKHR